jgi:hypothetical protein
VPGSQFAAFGVLMDLLPVLFWMSVALWCVPRTLFWIALLAWTVTFVAMWVQLPGLLRYRAAGNTRSPFNAFDCNRADDARRPPEHRG